MDNMMAKPRMVAPEPPPRPRPDFPVTLPACPIPHDCCMDSLAMAYVPRQGWQNLYEPDVAHARGTLFAELDKPFIGEEVRFV